MYCYSFLYNIIAKNLKELIEFVSSKATFAEDRRVYLRFQYCCLLCPRTVATIVEIYKSSNAAEVNVAFHSFRLDRIRYRASPGGGG